MRYFNNEQYLTKEQLHPLGGVTLRFLFPNEYHVIVFRNRLSYGGTEGLWEIVVIYNNKIVEDTSINGIMFRQTDADVESVLEKVREL